MGQMLTAKPASRPIRAAACEPAGDLGSLLACVQAWELGRPGRHPGLHDAAMHQSHSRRCEYSLSSGAGHPAESTRSSTDQVACSCSCRQSACLQHGLVALVLHQVHMYTTDACSQHRQQACAQHASLTSDRRLHDLRIAAATTWNCATWLAVCRGAPSGSVKGWAPHALNVCRFGDTCFAEPHHAEA